MISGSTLTTELSLWRCLHRNRHVAGDDLSRIELSASAGVVDIDSREIVFGVVVQDHSLGNFAPSRTGLREARALGEVDVKNRGLGIQFHGSDRSVQEKFMFWASPDSPARSIRRNTFVHSVRAGVTANQDDEAVVRLSSRELEVIVPIARDHYASGLLSLAEDERIVRFWREHIPQNDRFMAVPAKSIRDRVVKVVVEEEVHSAGGAICASARRSISARWSS